MNRSPNLCSFYKTKQTVSLTTKIMTAIKTFIFIDLETTGLPQMENNTTKITEMCAVAVQADHIELGVFPRVNSKLSLCFNPNKLINPVAIDLTGLSNELLEHQPKFTLETVNMLSNWLEMNRKPVCLVAHNGNDFDYPILQAEIAKAGGTLSKDILCLDSLTAFRWLESDNEKVKEPDDSKANQQESVPFEFDDGFDEILCQIADDYEKESTPNPQKVNETTPKKQMIKPYSRASGSGSGDILNSSKRGISKSSFCSRRSYKLQDIFKRLTNKEITGAHEAEGDVLMLITCSATFGERFVAYANEKALKFCDVPKMTPGKRLGS